MRVEEFIKSPFLKGLTGCQLLTIIAWRMDINTVGWELSEAFHGLQKVTVKITSSLEMYAEIIEVAKKEKNVFYTSLQDKKEKMQKYIRQQHKLAQRHYRRK